MEIYPTSRSFGAPPPPYQYSPTSESNAEANFKPSIAVIIGVLTTMFSLTFLLLLYAKHCKRSPNIGPEDAFPAPPALLQADMGIDPSLVDALPMFTFGSLQGMKSSLECAVCLSKYEQSDILRLLPKCRHAFHLECLDTWLLYHSTCPLCRHFITAEDDLALDELVGQRLLAPHEAAGLETANVATGPRSSLSAPPGAENANPGRPEGGLLKEVGADGIARKDGMLLGSEGQAESGHWAPWGSLRKSFESGNSSGHRFSVAKHSRMPLPSPDNGAARRLGHRIVVADVVLQQRWSDFVPSDVLFLDAQTIFGPEERARVSVSRNEVPADSSSLFPTTVCAAEADSFTNKKQRSACGRAALLGPGGSKAREDLELGLEPPRLSAGKRCKAVRLDLESRALAFWIRAASLTASTPADESAAERSRPPGRIQRSLSDFSGLERIGHKRMPSREVLLAHPSPDMFYTEDQEEKSRKWSSIARRTVNWIMGGSSNRDKRTLT